MNHIDALKMKFAFTGTHAIVSTSFISQQDSRLLGQKDDADNPALIWESGFLDYGWWVYVPDEGWESWEEYGYSPGFIEWMKEALEQNINYVRIDSGGGDIDGAETHNW